MKAKEFYYEDRYQEDRYQLEDVVTVQEKKVTHRFYCYLIRKHYKSSSVNIDYQKKIAILHYDYGNRNIIDCRLLSANYRVVEVHFNSIGELMLTCLKNNTNRKAIYQQVKI